VIEDHHISSLHEEIEPLVMIHFPQFFYAMAVKINSENIPQTLSSIEKTWNKFIPEFPFTYSFLDEYIDRLYRGDEQTARIVRTFSIIAIFIACLGLFGLAAFAAERRTKEIGIRKVLGATSSKITLLLSTEFTKWVLVANIIAWPIAYYAMNRWLQGFAYRISIGLWTFVLAAVLAFVIALLTVSYQALKAAIANPVEALRYE
jgi:putative ABC transport system permease protein